MSTVASRLATKTAQRALQLELKETIVPLFWTGNYDVVDPSRYRIDGGGKISKEDLHEGSALGQEIKAKYDDIGAVHVLNTGLTDMHDQRRMAEIVVKNQTDYEGGANCRDRSDILGNLYDTGAPPEAELHYHHEMMYKSHSIESIAFLCKWTVTSRPGEGWSFISDSVQAHDMIMQTELGQKLKEKGLCYIKRLTDANAYKDRDSSGVYNHWQQSWMTDDPAEAQAAADEQNVQIKWIESPTEGLSMETYYYIDAFEYVPFLDRNILVSAVGDGGDWFDTYPVINQTPLGQRPMEMTFGDNTLISFEERQLWTDIYDKFGIPIEWAPGDVAIICNMRFAHGRPSIDLGPGEQRELGVMLGPLFERQRQREGKW